MANYRNEFEFRSGLLDALGVEHSEADAKNEERWRAKMLDGLEVEYNQNDVNQFDLFRAKLVEGVEAKAEGGGGGGGSSDFSIAEVTIYNNSGDDNVTVSAVCINNDKLENIFLGITGHSNTKIYAVLYKGESAGIDISHGTSVISISGDITYDEDTFMYYATGDCSISFT